MALVEVVDAEGVVTGEHMYVRYCSTCQRGHPLHLFPAGHRTCRPCLERLQQRNAAGRPACVVEEDSSRQWAAFDTPLLVGDAPHVGLCKAIGCNAARHRRGMQGASARGNNDLYPLCDHHRQVWERLVPHPLDAALWLVAPAWPAAAVLRRQCCAVARRGGIGAAPLLVASALLLA